MSLDASAADLENHPAASPLPLRDTKRSRITAPSSSLLGWPLNGDITQGFGCSPYYTGLAGPGCPAEAPWFHDGLDIGAAAGTPVRAALTGTVHFAGPDGSGPLCNGGYRGYGLAVVIDNGAGWQALYGHLSHIAVVAGQNVTEETIIGSIGDTGCTSGPHLHFGLRYEGNLLNPVDSKR
jgi:murein DD-endopeptidase MepM/ murein hydrolase activator NlpD